MREIRRYGYALLQVVNRLVLKVDLLGAVDVGSIGENADGHAGAGDMGKPAQTQRNPDSQTLPGQTDVRADALDGTRETLVTLRVVVLETNLEFNGLHKLLLLLAIGSSQKLTDGAPHT